MLNRTLCALCGLVILSLSNPVNANTIPPGYVLVPISALNNPALNAIGGPPPATSFSAQNSALRFNDEIGFLGEKLLATVTLRNKDKQPLVNHPVELKSSRATDQIQALTPLTNTNGEARFAVQAAKEGVSTFTAIEQTSGNLILEQPRIVFLKKTLKSNLLAADVKASTKAKFTNPTYQIEVSDFPQTVTAKKTYDLKVTIRNSTGEIEEAFMGEIRFKSLDPNAILPSPYTFTNLDRGQHTFAGGVTFLTPGPTTLALTADKAQTTLLDFKVLGERNQTEQPTITSPANNFLTNQKLTLTGKASPNSNLALLVNDQIFTKGETNSAGDFTFAIELENGEYELAVALLKSANQLGAISAKQKVLIDKTPPTLEKIEIVQGPTLELGTTTKINLTSEIALKKATAKIGSATINLLEKEPKTYQGEFTGAEEGIFPVEISLQDLANNQTLVADAAEIEVIYPEPELTIFDLKLTPRNQKVELTFTPPANQAEISNYQISYGPNSAALKQTFRTPDAKTTWSIANLNNGTNYFFQVFSSTQDGRINGFSEVLNATPVHQTGLTAKACDKRIQLSWRPNPKIAKWQIAYGSKPNAPSEFRTLPAEKTEWEVRDLINNITYFFQLNGLAQNGTVILSAPDEEVRARPLTGACHKAPPQTSLKISQRIEPDGRLTLFWPSAPKATHYRILSGTQPNTFELPPVEVRATSYQPANLIPGQTYHFAVQALYSGQHPAAQLSNLLQVKALETEVGPPLAILCASLLAALGGLIWRKKKQLDIK